MEENVIMPPVHPGEILLTEFLEPLELSQYQLARSIAVPPRRINEIVHGQRKISAETALRLARFFGTSERFWKNLQSRYELELRPGRNWACCPPSACQCGRRTGLPMDTTARASYISPDFMGTTPSTSVTPFLAR